MSSNATNGSGYQGFNKNVTGLMPTLRDVQVFHVARLEAG